MSPTATAALANLDPATPATGCPTISDPAGLHDAGTFTGPTGEYRADRAAAFRADAWNECPLLNN